MILVRELVWDVWNVAHIARHEVTPEEVEEVEEVCWGFTHSSRTYQGRLRVIGQTVSGRTLTVILAPVQTEIYYPVTARPASRRERRTYRESEKGVTE